jgi:hypothetical protein
MDQTPDFAVLLLPSRSRFTISSIISIVRLCGVLAGSPFLVYHEQHWPRNILPPIKDFNDEFQPPF